MDEEQYADCQAQIMAIARLVNPLPLDEFIDAGRRALEFGLFVDPTLWMKGNKKLDQILKLAHALKGFQDEIQRQLVEGER